ncbi:MAG: HAD-IC family P-type ATPase [Acidobacteriota bacterium]|nr:HAD-IC family P-type ATPase [Acidobacteriota bacterium]
MGPQVRAGSSGPGTLDDEAGLDSAQVDARVAAGAVNRAPPTPARGLPQILRANVLTRFNAILGSLLVVVAVVGPVQDGLFGVVLVVNTAVGVVQELRAKRTLDRLSILHAPRVHVVREHTARAVAAEEIVVDDVVELRPGDQVVVDGPVVRAEGLELDESLLTGESAPVAKPVGATALSGSFVVSGTGRMRAERIGADAYATCLEARAKRFRLIRSELQEGTNAILRMVTWVMVPAGVGLVLSQLWRSHQSAADALRGSVAGVAAMVPEGLVLLTSIAFAVGAVRLAGRHVLVQELPAVEGLARVDVLCIDKTGTLTAPGMQLTSVDALDGRPPEAIRELLDAVVEADPAPNATLEALRRPGRPGPGWRVETRVPFSSSRKWSAVRFAGRGTWVLGAPDVLGRALAPGAAPTTKGADERRTLLLATVGPPAGDGPPAHGGPTETLAAGSEIPAPLTPVALLGLSERLRPDAARTIRYLADEGVAVKVLSGDAPATVAAVARDTGIAVEGGAVDASALPDDDALADAVGGASVFGRIRPEQKVAAVRALQRQGHVVAMVGDGVNDVQALKEADLGIAMGSGSQSSRAVARLVLLDDAFSAVPIILAEGRRVVANIERVANLFVTKTVYAALLAIVVAAAAVPFPFFPRHLTIVSTFTIGVPGFFLALASGAPRAVAGFTARVLRFTVPAGLAAGTATLASYAIARALPAATATEARTAAMVTLYGVGIWVLGRIARPLVAPRAALVALMAASVVPFLAVPLGRRVFGLSVPPLDALLAVVAVVVGAVVALELWWRHGPSTTPGPRPSSGRPAQPRE